MGRHGAGNTLKCPPNFWFPQCRAGGRSWELQVGGGPARPSGRGGEGRGQALDGRVSCCLGGGGRAHSFTASKGIWELNSTIYVFNSNRPII